MGLSCTVSKIDGNFSRKSQKFPTPLYFVPPLKGFPWNWVLALGQKKSRMMGLPGRERSLTISLAVWIQYTNVTDGRTDGQTLTDKYRAWRSGCAVKNDGGWCPLHVLRLDTIHQSDGRTDRRTNTGRQQVSRLCMTLRNKQLKMSPFERS